MKPDSVTRKTHCNLENDQTQARGVGQPYPISPFAFAIAVRNISGVSLPVFVL